MFITSELLAKYEACIEGQEWFAHHFPDGATVMDILKTPHVPLAFLHWGKLYLNTTPEEVKIYEEICHIQNCKSYFECNHAENSSCIDNSEYVMDSHYVFNSNHVDNSDQVQRSEQVSNSQNILNSTSVTSSKWCFDSRSVKQSENISCSSFIIESHDIYKSSLVTNSSFVFESNDVTKSGFVAHCNNVEYCLFCADCSEKQYMIFNHSVKPTQWNYIYDEYKQLMTEHHLNLFEEWETDAIDPIVVENYSYLQMFKLFEEFLPTFVKWVQNLPYYDPIIAYQITFIPNFLQ